MNFQHAPQNGITPPTPLGTIQSNFKLIASSTSTSYGKPIILKALSDAAVYKENPVTFYSNWNNGTTTTTITLGTNTFQTVSFAPLVLNTLQTGTHQIYAVWPGQGKFAGQSTELTPVTVSVASGEQLGGSFTLTASVPSGTAIAGETPITFEAVLSTSTYVTGSFVFYEDHTQLGSVTIFENAGFLTIPYLDPGDHTIQVVWAGADVNGTIYEGVSTSIDYVVLAGTTSNATLSLTFNPSYGIYQEGNIQMIATLNTSTSLPGNISFYDYNSNLLGLVPVVNNQADYTIFNNLSTGTFDYTAVWDGNQTSTPRYLSLTTTRTLQILDKELPDTLYLTISPNPSSYMVNTVFTAFFTATTDIAYTGTVVFFNGQTPIGSATLTNNVAVLQSTSLAPGSYDITAYYPGSNVSPKFYSTSSDVVSLSVATGLSFPTPMSLTVTNDNYLGLNQFVAGYPIEFTLDINTTTNLSNQPTFIVQNYQSLTSSTFIFNGTNNISTATYIYTSPGTNSVYGLWQGGLDSGQFYSAQRTNPQTVFTVSSGYNLPEPLNIDVTNSAYRGTHNPYVVNETQTITANITTATNLNGPVDFYVNSTHIGSSTFVNSVAQFPTTFNSSGTYTIQAIWEGGTDINGRPFNGETSSLFTLTAVTAYTLDRPITVSVKSSDPLASQYYLGDIQTIIASVSTSSQLTGPVDFYDNGSFIGTGTFSSGTTASITVALNSGTQQLYARWHNGTADGGYPYYATTSSITTSSVRLPYTVNAPTLTISPIRVISEPLTVTATITTSSQLSNIVNFYAGSTLLGSSSINSLTNQATLITTAPSTSGTYAVTATWVGGFIPNHTFYSSATSTATSIFVDIGQHTLGGLTVNAPLNNINTQPITLTANLNTTTIFNNTVTFNKLSYSVPSSLGLYSTNPFSAAQTTGTGITIVVTNIQNCSVGQTVTVTGTVPTTFTTGTTTVTSGTYSTNYTITNVYSSSTWEYVGSYYYQMPLGYHSVSLSKINSGDKDILSYVINGNATNMSLQPIQTGTTTITTLGSSIMSNNSATLTIPANSFSTGTFEIQAIWSGQSIIPKYYGTNSNIISIAEVGMSPSLMQIDWMTYNKALEYGGYNQYQGYTGGVEFTQQNNYSTLDLPPYFYLLSHTGTNVVSTVTFEVHVLGAYTNNPPSGVVNLYDGTTLLGSGILQKSNLTDTGPIQSESYVSISWDAVKAGQISSSTPIATSGPGRGYPASVRTITIQYGGDGVWNGPSSMTTAIAMIWTNAPTSGN